MLNGACDVNGGLARPPNAAYDNWSLGPELRKANVPYLYMHNVGGPYGAGAFYQRDFIAYADRIENGKVLRAFNETYAVPGRAIRTSSTSSGISLRKGSKKYNVIK